MVEGEMIRLGVAPYLECSTRGDRRFSALVARPTRFGGARSIEELYQGYKTFADRQRTLCVNIVEARALYAHLWDCYIAENQHLLLVLRQATGLSDMFGQTGHACQAEELWRIRNAK